MDEVAKGAIRFADGVGGLASVVLRSFGFLPDGRELIGEEKKGGHLVVRFSDRAEEGWPPCEVRLPEGARFDQAWSSVLSRGGMWWSRTPVNEAAQVIRGGFAPEDLRYRRKDGALKLRVDRLCLRIGVRRARPPARRGRRGEAAPEEPWILINIGQRRDEEDVRRGLMVRAAAYRER